MTGGVMPGTSFPNSARARSPRHARSGFSMSLTAANSIASFVVLGQHQRVDEADRGGFHAAANRVLQIGDVPVSWLTENDELHAFHGTRVLLARTPNDRSHAPVDRLWPRQPAPARRPGQGPPRRRRFLAAETTAGKPPRSGPLGLSSVNSRLPTSPMTSQKPPDSMSTSNRSRTAEIGVLVTRASRRPSPPRMSVAYGQRRLGTGNETADAPFHVTKDEHVLQLPVCVISIVKAAFPSSV